MALIIPNSIENDTPADAAELQQNFSEIQTYVNTNLVNRDGSVALTQPLTLPGDPSQPNHAANKDYVDTAVDTLEATVDSAGRGIVAYAEVVSGSQGSITSVVDLTGLSVTFTAVAGRRYKVTGHGHFTSTSVGDVADLIIATGANNQLAVARATITAIFVGFSTLPVWVSGASVSGSTTYKLRANRVFGTGALTNNYDTAWPGFILVEDIGIL